MSPKVSILLFALIVCALAIVVKWEYRRAKRGPRLKSDDTRRQLEGYTPPPDRAKHSFDYGPRRWRSE
jgi:hypothetical protein